MPPIYHILNGDALREQLRDPLAGEIIVARECLVDGSVAAESLADLFALRATFIAEVYGACTKEVYHAGSAEEFTKIKHIIPGSDIHLWFEDDLFCQVNFWFTASLIYEHTTDCSVFLIRPKEHTQYGFGGLNQEALQQALTDRQSIDDLAPFARLWAAYQNDDEETLQAIAATLKADFPFVETAVTAHLARKPTQNSPGRPTELLLQIMADLETTEFAPVFREFQRRAPEYGFGDLQVRKLMGDFKHLEN